MSYGRVLKTRPQDRFFVVSAATPNPQKPTQPNPTQPAGLGWVTKIFLIAGRAGFGS